MDFKTTFIKRPSSRRYRRGQQGLTLIEFLIASGVAALVLGAAASLSYYSARTFTGIVNYVDLDMKSRAALDQMSKDIRQSSSLTTNTSTMLRFDYGSGYTLQYDYSETERTLSRTLSPPGSRGTPKVLLTECDYLNFGVYQRNPVGGTYNQYPAATPATCKLVQLNWVCSRTILGAKVNTESVQSAKIVIRRQ